MDILGIAVRKIGSKYQHCLKVIYGSNIVIREKCTTVNVAHRIHGPRPTPNSVPIIVLHGCLGSKKNWEQMCNYITASTNKTVIAVDARNHGDSPYTDDHDYYSLAADVSYLMTKLSIKKGIIMGHCMGGKTGMVLALSEPEKVASLIVVDTSPISTPSYLEDDYPKIIKAMSNIDFKGMDLQNARHFARYQMLGLNLFYSEDELQKILLNIGKLTDNKSIGWRYNLDTLLDTADEVNSFPDVSGKIYNGPTLFLAGKLSHAVPPEDVEEIRKLFPAAYMVYLEGVGHNVHTEDPNAFFNTITQFLFYNSMIQTTN